MRMAKASANQVYGFKQYTERGPFPKELKMEAAVAAGGNDKIQITYDRDFVYNPKAGWSGMGPTSPCWCLNHFIPIQLSLF